MCWDITGTQYLQRTKYFHMVFLLRLKLPVLSLYLSPYCSWSRINQSDISLKLVMFKVNHSLCSDNWNLSWRPDKKPPTPPIKKPYQALLLHIKCDHAGFTPFVQLRSVSLSIITDHMNAFKESAVSGWLNLWGYLNIRVTEPALVIGLLNNTFNKSCYSAIWVFGVSERLTDQSIQRVNLQKKFLMYSYRRLLLGLHCMLHQAVANWFAATSLLPKYSRTVNVERNNVQSPLRDSHICEASWKTTMFHRRTNFLFL